MKMKQSFSDAFQGSFGEVFKGKWNGATVACKKINEKQLMNSQQELSMLK